MEIMKTHISLQRLVLKISLWGSMWMLQACANTAPLQNSPDPLLNSSPTLDTIKLQADDIQWAPLAPTGINGGLVTTPNLPLTALLEGEESSGEFKIRLLEYRAPIAGQAHMHPSTERIYVVSGTIEAAIGSGSALASYSEGSFLRIPAYTPHYANVNGPATIMIIQDGDYTVLPVEARKEK